MLRRDHKHDWRKTSAVVNAACTLGCRCGAVVRVRKLNGKIMPEVLADGGHTFSVDDAQKIVAVSVGVLGPP